MPSTASPPTLSQVQAWDTAHLTDAATTWSRSATVWEDTFTQLSQRISRPGGVRWLGEAADAAQGRAHADRLIVVGYADRLHSAAGVARAGADQLTSARAAVLRAVETAENAGFTVEEDFSVTSTETGDTAYLAARQSQAEALAASIHGRLADLVSADQQVATDVSAAAEGLGNGTFAESDGSVGDRNDPRIQLVDNETVVDGDGPAPQAGQPVDPTNPFIGDSRFGYWENVIAPPYTGATPPPLKSEYRPFPPGTPAKNGGPTEWYTPGRTWVNDLDAPLASRQEQYKFRIAGQEATTYTRMVNQNGVMHQQRWVQNVFEAQHNTMWKFNGEVPARSGGGWKTGDVGGLPAIPTFGDWKPMAPNQIASLSAGNPTVTFYIPDGCGGQFTYENGVAVGGFSGQPVNPIPIMTAPR
ncbi:hypothetical protein [Mycolicibacterium mengxianglii]|uniref:hypothetical protein n=1 Tax=Mycolicibacterium mengxianglii TaxID=2736649 RepID=UPI0018EF0F09|nr:hypothetical protein [Mycolicibacterium mengxianglii]